LRKSFQQKIDTGSMDLSSADLEQFIQASMPLRFGDVSPYDFEAFVAELFRRDGYEVRETSYSGDFGADLLVEMDGKMTVVQVKRYATQTQVGVGDLNQVIGARTYYKADAALVITTSGFTQAAVTLARSAQIMLWDWERLQQFISRVVLDGQDYYQYFAEAIAEQESTGELEAHFLRFHPGEMVADNRPAIAVHIGLENATGKNCYINVDPPLIITSKQRQVTAVEWIESYFHQGLLVSGATAEIACKFLSDQVTEVKTGDRIILRVFIEGQQEPVLIDQRVGASGSACYVVTFCYGRDSTEYRAMIRWRTEVWHQSGIGRILSSVYNRTSPAMINYVSGQKPGWRLIGGLMRMIALVMSRIALDWWSNKQE
jgi:hypothetical protein